VTGQRSGKRTIRRRSASWRPCSSRGGAGLRWAYLMGRRLCPETRWLGWLRVLSVPRNKSWGSGPGLGPRRAGCGHSTREFYTYLTQGLSRFDLDRGEFQAFKSALLDYLQRFVDEISRYMPQIANLLGRLAPRVPSLCERANTAPTSKRRLARYSA
jgi:Protein of unknown function (DUF2397)